ncbi:MAG: SDR family NAD(P)-dependent oxidoreductase [Halobacteriales archaeon]
MADRTVLVAGAGSAVGRATALTFREDGWTVYAAAREQGDVADLSEYGVVTDELDVTDDADVRRAIKRVATNEGRLDCVAFDPRGTGFGPLAELDPDDARAAVEESAFALQRLAHEAVPHLREAEGTLVAVSSAFGRFAAPGTGAFAAGHAATGAMADALRAETADAVDVTVVEPSLVDDGTRQAAADAARAGEDTDGDGVDSGDENSHGEYAWVRDALGDFATFGEGGLLGTSPGAVAAAVVDAAVVSDPAPRSPVGGAAKWLAVARYLPDRWRDAAFAVVRRLP